ncbi:methyl-accepting chemotaxis protein [Devosia sp. XJ19-1]|uniref:Methyl-accepting chemotaxis protein n=1 Tax=Devosia ureilytica TaxID=2952754 RepID=A0A9Q4ANZ0_9HYPH|nr:methyl-accepting chemotaxis protein [Devosia ureilytica]MCP8883449.1 methyl-accepting chemotaxis protein [Devosia ureilytica]MCP8887057.1 methyl-accepting chemotaxis protein [Devosia ureilytica]
MAQSAQTSDLLLTSAGAWALERGLTNTALSAEAPVSAAVSEQIAGRREAGDAALTAALARVATQAEFQGREQLVSALTTAAQKVVSLRVEADAALAKPLTARPPELLATWVPTMTGLIIASQNLREGAKFVADSTATRIAMLETMRGEVWTMSEFSGRERALIGGIIASGAPISAQMLNTLSINRGRVEQAWFNIEAYLGREGAAPELQAAAAIVRQEFFGTFEALRLPIYAAGTTGGAYPVTASEWVAQSTAAIDTLLELATTSVTVAGAVTTDAIGSAQISLGVGAAMLSLGLALAAIGLWVAIARTTGPLRRITASMTALSDGRLETTVPFVSRQDEIGEMAAAVQVFKENGIRIAALGAEETERVRTAQMRAEMMMEFQREFDGVIAATAGGDFTRRIEATYPDPDIARIAANFNGVLETTNAALGEAGGVLSALARTDLTQRMKGNYRGVFAALRDDTNLVGDKLTDLVTQLRITSRALKTATGEILAGANDLSERTTRQAATIEETSAAMEQLATTVTETARKAEVGAERTRSAAGIAEEGRDVMDAATIAMQRITQSSSKISNIIGMIDDIAFQTNLLALNASVEAARAGEAGKGFAVVAVEVRRLAQSAAQASSEVKQLIEQSGQEVDGGTRLVASAADKLGAILTAVRENSALIAEIATASTGQSTAIAEVTTAVRQMDEMTQHNAALVEETNAAIEQTEAQAVELDQIISVFRLNTDAPAGTGQPRRSLRTEGNAAIAPDWSEF